MTDPAFKLPPENESALRKFLASLFTGLIVRLSPAAVLQFVVSLFPASFFSAVRDKLRASPLAVLFLISFAAVVYIAPQKAGLALFGLSKIALGAYIGYWADRLCFRPEDRPHKLEGISKGAAWKRRAVIVAACIVAAALIP